MTAHLARLRPLVALVLIASIRPHSLPAQGLSPEVAAARMTAADDLTVRLVASEPLVRQPVAIDFDDRGRLWVIQYLQYPNPEGLRRVEVDRYSRTRYDRLPEPPPRGPKGADRITILEDTDGDGRMDRGKDFVTGLNLASGFAFGDGGVYVLNVPYLLFYPDRDRDDVPDGDPEVLLTGFGMEDAHSVANSLTWGPDGWLYGLQGSTVTANINGVEFQQGVWRHHPRTRRFELFAEGGGNMWGLDFDRQGNLLASTNVGGNVMLHFVQGGSYWKQFGKHGPLHNPYAFGYFEHVEHESVRGGHVAVGGLFYFAEAWPEPYRGKYLAGDLLGHGAHWHEFMPYRSTFRARQVGDLLDAHDPWFAPTDLALGPDGSVYLTDWHDRRTAHPDPDADWDRTSGRIYALDGPGRSPVPPGFDLAARSSTGLLAMLDHPNIWFVRRARRLLIERRDEAIRDDVLARAAGCCGVEALEALWVAFGCGWVDDRRWAGLLQAPDADIRAAAVRLIGDDPAVGDRHADQLRTLATSEPDVRVRAQLAATARRLSDAAGLAIAQELLRRDLDADDPHVPLLLWWAIERHVGAGGEPARRFLLDRRAWESSLDRREIAPRLARRWATEGTGEGDALAARLLSEAPDEDAKRIVLAGLDQGLAGRKPGDMTDALRGPLLALAGDEPGDPLRARLAIRAGADALDRALADDGRTPFVEADRVALIEVAAEAGGEGAAPLLLDLALGSGSGPVRLAALKALGRFDFPMTPRRLLEAYPGRAPDAEWRSRVRDLLLGRKEWAGAFLGAVETGRIDPKDVALDQVGRIALLRDAGLDARVRAIWGRVAGPTPEQKLAEVRRLNNDLRAATGDAVRGRDLFRKHCASCHRLQGEGNLVGPELTGSNRSDRDWLLVSLVDPSSVVRKEYTASVVGLKDGRILTGLLAERTPREITLVDGRAERVTVPRDEIESIADSDASVMPDNLYRELSPQDLRDLFAFLQQP